MSGSFDRSVGLELHEAATKVFGRTLWMTLNTFRYYLDETKEHYVDVPLGYLTDGASVPTIATSIFPRFDYYAQSALVHDYLCEYLFVFNKDGRKVPITRDRADAIFHEAMLAQGIDPLKAKTMYKAVRTFVVLCGVREPTYCPIKVEFEVANRKLLADRNKCYYK